LWVVSGYIYTGQASMDMDMDGKFHIHGNPGHSPGQFPYTVEFRLQLGVGLVELGSG